MDECIKAVREELRRGAHCIKIMGSGGVASPTDPIWMNQYREDECVRSSTRRPSGAHIRGSLPSGERDPAQRRVRRTLHRARHVIDAATAKFVASKGAYIVPTMIIIFVLVEIGKSWIPRAKSGEGCSRPMSRPSPEWTSCARRG